MEMNKFETAIIFKLITDCNDGTDRFKTYIGTTHEDLDYKIDDFEDSFKVMSSKERLRRRVGLSEKMRKGTGLYEIMSSSWYEIIEIKKIVHPAYDKQFLYKEVSKVMEEYKNDVNYKVVNKKNKPIETKPDTRKYPKCNTEEDWVAHADLKRFDRLMNE